LTRVCLFDLSINFHTYLHTLITFAVLKRQGGLERISKDLKFNLMDENENIPKRSKFWFSNNSSGERKLKFFDNITVVFSASLFIFSFAIFWPIVSKFSWEETFFTPLIPSLIVWFEALGVDASVILRIIFISSFAFSILGLYFLVREITSRQITPIFSAILYMVPSIPIFVILYFQRGLYAWELASAQSFFSIIYGDVAHFLALSFIPPALIFFLRFEKSDRKLDFLLCELFTILVLMSNRSQGFYLFVGFGIITLTEVFLGAARIKIKRALLVMIVGVGLVSFWYTPFYLFGISQVLISQLGQNLRYLFPLPFVISIVSLILSFVFLARKKGRQGIFISFLMFIIFLALTVHWLSQDKSFLVHPNRVIPNLYMFTSIILAIVLTFVIDKLHLVGRFAFEKWSPPLKVIGSVAFGIISFGILAATAYFVAPLAIRAVSGPGGTWAKIKEQAEADKMESLKLVGSNFSLKIPDLAPWQTALGVALTLLSLAFLIVWFVKKSHEQQ